MSDGTSNRALPQNIDLENWMGDMSETIGDMPVSQIIMPGSHDAGTNALGAGAKTQSDYIGNQLKVGVRYFDIRPRLWSDLGLNTRYEWYHGNTIHGGLYYKYYPTETGDLIAFGKWIQNHPKEIVIIDLWNYYNDVSDLNLIESYTGMACGDGVIWMNSPTAQFTPANTYNEIVNGGYHVFLNIANRNGQINDRGTYDSNNPAGLLLSTAIDASIDSVENVMTTPWQDANGEPILDQFWRASAILHVTGENITQTGNPTVAVCAGFLNKEIKTRVTGAGSWTKYHKNFNIIMTDNVNEDDVNVSPLGDLQTAIIQLNLRDPLVPGTLQTANWAADGSFSGWTPVLGGGNTGQDPFPASLAAIAGMPDETLQFLVQTPGDTGRVYHAVCGADGTLQGLGWAPLAGYNGANSFAGNSLGITGMPVPDTDPAYMQSQAVAVGDDAFVYHNLRKPGGPSGSWQGWQQVSGVSNVSQVAITGLEDGTSQVVAEDASAQIWHNIRYADGSWQGWRMAGNEGASSLSVGIAAILGATSGNGEGSTQVVAVDGNGWLIGRTRTSNGAWYNWSNSGMAADQVAIAPLPMDTYNESDRAYRILATNNDILWRIDFISGYQMWHQKFTVPGFEGGYFDARKARIAARPDGSVHILAITTPKTTPHP
ncbi:hypothetical protein [Streptomyces sp. 1222.5]|uniref:hypothetical protein n=1 Tax=Streptomyces sp. 1222.5 TaxID=1881026 RepID=UPI003D724EF4